MLHWPPGAPQRYQRMDFELRLNGGEGKCSKLYVNSAGIDINGSVLVVSSAHLGLFKFQGCFALVSDCSLMNTFDFQAKIKCP